MFEKFGESAKMSISYAVHLSRGLNHYYLGTEHLFLGVMELEDVNITRQLQKAGLDIERAKKEILEEAGKGEETEKDQISLTKRTEKVLEMAAEEAFRLGQETVEAPDILIGILDEKKGIAARVISREGGDLGKIAENLRRMLVSNEWTPDFYAERKAVEQPGIEKTSDLMQNLGRNLTQMAQEKKLDPIIGREKELLDVIQILTSRKKSNPMLVGEAGVGKTAIVEGLAQLITAGKVPPELEGKKIQSVEIGSLVAGTGFRGAFEQSLLEFVHDAKEDPDRIIFIDEIHMLVGAGTGGSGSMDAANILKPSLSRGDFKVIGATTYAEYRKYIESDAALARRFQPVYIGESTPEDSLEILNGLCRKYEDFHSVKILDEALGAAVELSNRYITDRRLPDKAIDLIDRACSQKKLRSYYGFSQVVGLSPEEKKTIFSGEFDTPDSTILLITREDVARIVSDWTGIPIGKLTEKESDKLIKLEQLMKGRMIGQDEAVHEVAQSIRTSRSGLRDSKRPVGSFLFLGPTGVGKTELAKTLAEILFDDEEKIIRVDMSECYDKHFISRLIGSPHGYVDSDKGGQLTEAVKKHPYSIVLFDEVEKADPQVLDLLLQIMEDGRLTDGLGRLVNFRDTVVIMTSNVGSARILGDRQVGFDTRTREEKESGISKKDIDNEVNKELRHVFKPEFLNRIDEVIIFDALSREDLRGIAELMLSKIPVDVEANQEVIDFLIDERYDPTMGARPLRRTIEDLIVEPLANKIIEGKYSERDVIRLRLSDGEISFRKKAVKK